MARRPKLLSFFRIPLRLQWLALEAGWQLVRARIDTLGPASSYTRHLGEMAREADEPSPHATPEQETTAVEIGAVVARAAPWMPFRALCLQQALATRRMLRRRDVPAVVYLGLAVDPADRTSSQDPAHAWVQTGQLIVNGDGDLERFAVVGTFA